MKRIKAIVSDDRDAKSASSKSGQVTSKHVTSGQNLIDDTDAIQLKRPQTSRVSTSNAAQVSNPPATTFTIFAMPFEVHFPEPGLRIWRFHAWCQLRSPHVVTRELI